MIERDAKIFTKRQNRFGQEKDFVVDYKNTRFLNQFLTEQGKMITRRMTGTTRHQQYQLEKAIKRARHLALLPYTLNHAIRD